MPKHTLKASVVIPREDIDRARLHKESLDKYREKQFVLEYLLPRMSKQFLEYFQHKIIIKDDYNPKDMTYSFEGVLEINEWDLEVERLLSRVSEIGTVANEILSGEESND